MGPGFCAGVSPGNSHHDATREKGWGLVLLSFSALGIIYGDIGTSPLYAYQAVFSSPPPESEVLSAASLFFWTLTLIVLVKYVGIIIRFDDNGEGGTFALYSLMCRAAGFTAFGRAQREELQLSGHRPGPLWGHWWSLANDKCSGLRRAYARSRGLQVSLLLVVIMATAMVVGDGVLTPSISVLSAVSGLKVAAPGMQQGEIVGVAIVVLVLLFSVQYLGTAKISAAFAPIVAVWLLFNAAIGFYNLSTCGWGIWQALSPAYGIRAFTGDGGFESGWRLLAGVMLAITGAEAMYADIGHFNAKAVRLSFCCLVYPCLVVTYMGQASFLIANPDKYTDPFWHSVPHGAFWPMLIVATAASVVASQALISGVYSIMRQAMNMGVFPPMKVTNTDAVTEGQIYIRSINWMLMVGCVAMVAGFQDTTALGHAYGVAVMSVMFITTILAGIVMLVCYGINPLLVALFMLFFVPLEGLFLSSNIIKIPEGGWVTIMIAAVVASINMTWWYGSGAKSRWYKAQADRNKGLLAQLGDIDEKDEEDGGKAAKSLISAAAAAASTRRRHPTGSVTDESAQWTTAGAAATGDSMTAERLRSSSAPMRGPGGVSVLEGPETAGKGAAGAAAVRGQLVAQSWCAGMRPGAAGGSGGAVLFDSKPITRLPGLGIIYTQATSGLPAVLQHMLVNMPVLHQVVVLLTVRVIPRPYASEDERFLVRRSNTLEGTYRVIVRYGYMEQVDHGSAFVRQLTNCLIRYAAQQPHADQDPAAAGTTPGTAAYASAPSAHAPGASEATVAGLGGTHSSSGGAVSPAEDAVVIELQPVDEAAAAAAAAAGPSVVTGEGGLARWSRMPAAPADAEEILAEATSGKDLAAGLSFSTLSSPRTSLDLPAATGKGPSAGLTGPLGAPLVPLLGRESLNRHQYGLQKLSHHRHARAAAGAQGACSSASSITQGAAAPEGGADAFATVCAPGSARQSGGGGGAGSAGGAVVMASPAAAGGPSPKQVAEIDLLLRCLQHRAVFIMGRSQLVAGATGAGAAGPKGLRGVGRAVGAYGRGLVTGAYRVLSNNTHPASQGWQLPDDQLVLVSMVVRI